MEVEIVAHGWEVEVGILNAADDLCGFVYEVLGSTPGRVVFLG